MASCLPPPADNHIIQGQRVAISTSGSWAPFDSQGLKAGDLLCKISNRELRCKQAYGYRDGKARQWQVMGPEARCQFKSRSVILQTTLVLCQPDNNGHFLSTKQH